MPYSLQSLLLIAFGALFALLFVLSALGKTLARRERVVFFDLLLAFAATVLVVLGLVFNQFEPEQATPLAQPAALATAGGLVVIGLLVALIDARRPQGLRGSRGLLGLWMGLLIGVSVLAVPRVGQRLLAIPAVPTAEAGQLAAESTARAAADTATPVPTATSSPTPSRIPTPSRTPRPTATPTLTREPFHVSTRAPVPTATPGNPCIGLVKYNLRLRARPTQESDTLRVIPFNTTVTIFGRNVDSTWWYVTYEDQTGWIDAGFVDASSSCADVPVRSEP